MELLYRKSGNMSLVFQAVFMLFTRNGHWTLWRNGVNLLNRRVNGRTELFIGCWQQLTCRICGSRAWRWLIWSVHSRLGRGHPRWSAVKRKRLIQSLKKAETLCIDFLKEAPERKCWHCVSLSTMSSYSANQLYIRETVFLCGGH